MMRQAWGLTRYGLAGLAKELLALVGLISPFAVAPAQVGAYAPAGASFAVYNDDSILSNCQ